jgi:hypothetical protein
MAKNTLKLKESDLKNIIKESVAKILKENHYNEMGVWDMIEAIKETIGADALVSRLISRMSPMQAMKILQDIYEVEVASQYNDEEEI